MKVELYQIEAPGRFCAGFIAVDGICDKAAPILRRFLGWTVLECRNSALAHRWNFYGPLFSGNRPNNQNESENCQTI